MIYPLTDFGEFGPVFILTVKRQPAKLQPNLTIYEVAQIRGLTYQQAYIWCKYHHYPWRRQNQSGLTREQTATLLREHAHLKLKEVGELLGVTRQRAHQLYLDHKIARTAPQPLKPHWSGNISCSWVDEISKTVSTKNKKKRS